VALIGYARVSTRDQNDESQVDLLAEAGCERIFQDKVSGKLAKRPDWDLCREYLRPGDTLVITRLARVARSLRNLLEFSAWLDERGVDLVVLKQHIDTRTPTGRLVFHILGAIDEFQADLIAENTREGLAAARARGRVGGRPRALSGTKLEQALKLYDARELTVAQIAEVVGTSRATIYRALEQREAEAKAGA
jgi:DNA invertase Pin-like site-specific DNA recombinase